MLSAMGYLERICGKLNEAGVRYALVGGYAVALHGAPRGTIDIDVAVRWTLQNVERAEAALNRAGLVSRLPVTAVEVFRHRDEYMEERNLLAWSFYNPDDPLETVDIIIAHDLTGNTVRPVELPACTVPVLSLEDLIEMKRLSGRPQDIEDVRALEKLR